MGGKRPSAEAGNSQASTAMNCSHGDQGVLDPKWSGETGDREEGCTVLQQGLQGQMAGRGGPCRQMRGSSVVGA